MVTWLDDNNNRHNLDFVLERNGTPLTFGTPVAFIEVAWRRYTKHSVNKAGEIANALLPLRRTYARTRPFTGAVVAGVWTDGGLGQMTNQGINILYIPFSEIVQAFAAYDIDVYFEESTAEAHLQAQVDAWEALSSAQREALALSLMRQSQDRYAAFRVQLDEHLRRQISRVLILPLHGDTLVFDTPDEAVASLLRYAPGQVPASLVRIEVQIRYSNGDKIDAEFHDISEAVAFLEAQS